MSYPDLDRKIWYSCDDECVADPKTDLYVVPPYEPERPKAKCERTWFKALLSNHRNHFDLHLKLKSKVFSSATHPFRETIENKLKEIFLVSSLFGLPPPIKVQRNF